MALVHSWALALMASALFLVSTAETAALRGVRYAKQGTLSRVIFDLSQETPYRLETVSDPTMLRVVFPPLTRPAPLTRPQTRGHLVREIRWSTTAEAVMADIILEEPGVVQQQKHMTAPARVVLDIARRPENRPTPATSTTIPPVNAADSRTQIVAEADTREAKKPRSAEPPPAGLSVQPPSASAPATLAPRATLPRRPSPVVGVSLAALSREQLLDKAEKDWGERQLEEAQRAYTLFLQRYPDYPKNHLIAARIADILREQQHLHAALEAYTAVMQGYPGSEGALMSQIRLAELGSVSPDLLPAGDETRYTAYRQPMPTLQRLIVEYPFSPLAEVARFKIGEIFLRQGELIPALESFAALLGRPLNETLQQDVAHSLRQTLVQLLTAQHQRGAFLEVLRTFFAHKQHLTPSQALHSDLLLPVALSYAQLGLLDEAQSLFASFLLSLPDPEQRNHLLFDQALRFAKHGQLPLAATLLTPPERFTEPGQRAQALSLLTQAAWQARQPGETVRYGQQAVAALSEPSTRSMLWGLLAAAHEARGDLQQAMHALQQCVQEARAAQPATAGQQAAACLAQETALQVRSEQPRESLAAYERLLQTLPSSARQEAMLFRMAELQRQQGAATQMRATLTRLRDNTNDPFWRHMATEYLTQAQWQERLQERLAIFQNSLMR